MDGQGDLFIGDKCSEESVKILAKEAPIVKVFNLFVVQFNVKAWFMSQIAVCKRSLDTP